MLNFKKNLRLVKAQKRKHSPSLLKGKQAENRSHNLGKALGEVLGHKFSYRRKDIKKERLKDGVFCEM